MTTPPRNVTIAGTLVRYWRAGVKRQVSAASEILQVEVVEDLRCRPTRRRRHRPVSERLANGGWRHMRTPSIVVPKRAYCELEQRQQASRKSLYVRG
jgi:hypothetical protein